MRKFLMIFGLFLLAGRLLPAAGDLTPFDILEEIDRNMTYRTAYTEMTMEISIRNRIITKTLRAYARGNENSFIEFLSPARDRGVRILKDGDVVMVYYPSAERVMRLSGHMLRQSMMGSDFSYQDMTERTTRLRDEYRGEILETEILNGNPCHVMMLTAKNPRETYYRRKIWVDRERYVGLKEELYAPSGKLLKTMTVDRVEKIHDRHYPTMITFRDMLRGNSATVMKITRITFDSEIPPGTFSERNLRR